MLDILQTINDKAEEDIFTHAVCDALGLDWLDATSADIAEKLSSTVMQEVNERYQLCPLDTKAKPIHVGDELEFIGRVQAIGKDMVCAGEMIHSDEPPYFSGYPHFAPDSYALVNPYREVLQDFAREHGVEVSPYTLGIYERRLKALQ